VENLIQKEMRLRYVGTTPLKQVRKGCFYKVKVLEFKKGKLFGFVYRISVYIPSRNLTFAYCSALSLMKDWRNDDKKAKK